MICASRYDDRRHTSRDDVRRVMMIGIPRCSSHNAHHDHHHTFTQRTWHNHAGYRHHNATHIITPRVPQIIITQRTSSRDA
eukprot:3031564-Pyramimonas_sp.AAC.2